MAQVTRVNGGIAAPVTKSVNQSLNGDMTMLTINFKDGSNAALDVSGKTGVNGGLEAVTKAIMNAGFNIVIMGTPFDSAGTADAWRIAVEGVFGTDTYDGSASETLAVHLEDVLQAVADVDGIDMSRTTVAAFDF